MNRWRSKLAALTTVSIVAVLLATPAAAQQSGNEQDSRVQVEYAPTMLVLDGSGSMTGNDPSGGTKMAAAKNSVRSLVDMLPDDAQFGLTTYGTETGETPAEKETGCQDTSVLQDVKQLDRQAITSAVDGIQPSGYTPIGHSLRTAADQLPDDKQRAIVLVSDGLDTCAPPDPCEVADELAEEGINTVVHAVGFGVDDEASEQLNCIAETTGGTYTRAPDATALEKALPRVTTVALRNYQPTGTPAKGSEQPAGAPEIGPGQYVDSLGPQQRKHYSVHIPKGGVGYFSATVPLTRGEGGMGDINSLEIDVTSPSGESCTDGGVRSLSTMGQDGVPLSTSAVVDTTEGNMGGDCQEAGTYTMYVLRDSDTAQQAELPIEVQVGVEPAVTGNKGEPSEMDTVRFQEQNGQAQPVVGGGSFSSAATLDGSEVYRDSLAHGEYVFYRVRLEWGQGLAYRVNYAGNKQAGLANVSTMLYSPFRKVPPSDGEDTDSYDGAPATLGPLATTPVRYLNRDEYEGGATSVAGWYYIGVKLGRGVEGDPPPALVDTELELTVTGEPENGPEYASGGDSGNGDVFGDGNAENSPAIAESPTTDSFPLVPVLAGAGGAVLLGGAAVTVWLVRRRNRMRP
ncbi:Ca-activated chloride channel family protein [Tamaricihabitans halophyticus]|uniref:Ca-activated chloride channel family protein n=1 Tax=Tamaricihabitans halophyticus TaxID=1262583 RepID=A0A4R2QXD6_9PSEU|nr:VWA domain-containing protein [Tamaricihabitans halophyticus]TCP53974.1 Ca-activated chloride channel family protein [Tamaricihabitans halophyticus]